MTFKRLRRLVAAAALVLLVPGGANSALADSEPASAATGISSTDESSRTSLPPSQRRVEDAWIAEQVHAEHRAGAGRRAAR